VTKAFAQLFKGSGKKKKPNVEKAKKLYATYLDGTSTLKAQTLLVSLSLH
jgi:hypothetical protein